MNYVIQKIDAKFGVFETHTEQLIKYFDKKEEARKFLRHLNLGGGFDSWTPSFFLRDISNFINKTRKDNKKASSYAEARDIKGQKE